MATLLYRLGRTGYRKWPIFIIGWVIGLVALGGLALSISKPMVDSISIPGLPSLQAQEMQQRLFPATAEDGNVATATVVIAAPLGHTLTEPRYAGAVNGMIAQLQQVPTVPAKALANPVLAADAQLRTATEVAERAGLPTARAEANAKALLPLSADGRIGTINWNFHVKTVEDVKPATQDAVLNVLAQARKSGLTAVASGSGMQARPESGGSSELIGVAVAALVLVITFGSLVAAGLPLMSALVGVAMGTLGITTATAFTDIGTTSQMIATMIGLAVGIDYALLILTRFRTELEHTDDRAQAMGLAVGRAGSAVVFAGMTVLIALAALSVVGIPVLTSMGLAAAGTVLFAVLVALTMLPAVLGMLKRFAFGGRLRRHVDSIDAEGHTVNNGVRWTRLLGRRPMIVVGLVVVILGALAAPVSQLHLALPTDSTAGRATPQRQSADLMAEAFGPGRQAPLVAVVDGTGIADAAKRPAAYGEVVDWAARQDDVANAQIVAWNKDGSQILITPKSGPDDEKTLALLYHLRNGQSSIEARTGTKVGVTGATAIQADVSDHLTVALPKYLAVVIGLAFLLLMLVFRSILVPLTATLGFLLSVLATLGATVLVFQQGFGGLVEAQPLVSFMPIFLIGIVFGLAMDYQVFLVTRMREAYVRGMSARDAVVDGFRHGARVVTAAASIMISVFAAFILQDNSLIRSMGFALAAGVLLDAFLIRMTLIPAVMYLLGDNSWWLPAWLDKLLPSVGVDREMTVGLGTSTRHPTEDELVTV